MYRVYGMAESGNCHKVRVTLDMLGQPYQWTETDMFKGATRSPEFLAMNPNGKIPVLEIEPGNYLPESNAIICYLAEGTRLMPSDRLGPRPAMAVLRAVLARTLYRSGAISPQAPSRSGIAARTRRQQDGRRLSRARNHGRSPGEVALLRRRPADRRRHRALCLHPCGAGRRLRPEAFPGGVLVARPLREPARILVDARVGCSR